MSFVLFGKTTLAAAGTVLGTRYRDRGMGGTSNLGVLASFLYGSGGTTAKAYVQTSFDGGLTWNDIMCFAFTTSAANAYLNAVPNFAVATPITPSDGALADNTVADGMFGTDFRVKLVTTGTYAGLSSISLVSEGIPLSPL